MIGNVISDAEIKQELGRGIVITDEITLKIQSVMEKILKKRDQEGVTRYRSHPDLFVFSLNSTPHLIFKMKSFSDRASLEARYDKMVKAKSCLESENLRLLTLPSAQLFSIDYDGKNYPILAEEKLDINPSDGAQEQYFDEYAEHLDETIRQLALFICKTGYSDVEWRNNPILNNMTDEKGNRRIGLIDVEEMREAETGLFGSSWRTGLVGLVTLKQAEIVLEVAEKEGVNTANFKYALEDRKITVADFAKLKEFYQRKGFTHGKEPLVVDVDSLGLNSTQVATYREWRGEPEITITLREVATTIINEINQQIEKSDDRNSIKGKRAVYLSSNALPFSCFRNFGLPPDCVYASREEMEQRWLVIILKALMKDNHIFNFVEDRGNNFRIQA